MINLLPLRLIFLYELMRETPIKRDSGKTYYGITKVLLAAILYSLLQKENLGTIEYIMISFFLY